MIELPFSSVDSTWWISIIVFTTNLIIFITTLIVRAALNCTFFIYTKFFLTRMNTSTINESYFKREFDRSVNEFSFTLKVSKHIF